MSLPGVWPQVLDFFGKPLVIEPSAGQLSGDAGLLPVRQFDQRVGLTRAFADALDDPRDPGLTEHSFSTRTAPRCRRWLRNRYAQLCARYLPWRHYLSYKESSATNFTRQGKNEALIRDRSSTGA